MLRPENCSAEVLHGDFGLGFVKAKEILRKSLKVFLTGADRQDCDMNFMQCF